jgi:hypothetical protein
MTMMMTMMMMMMMIHGEWGMLAELQAEREPGVRITCIYQREIVGGFPFIWGTACNVM